MPARGEQGIRGVLGGVRTRRDRANARIGWLGAADLICGQQLDDRSMSFGFREHQR